MLSGDPSNQQFTTSQLEAEIEKWQEQFVLDTRCLKDVSSVTVVSGTAEYSLPTDIFDVFRVAHKGLKLERVSAYELDILLNSDWTDDEGTPTKYFVDLDPNNQKIRLYPIPQSEDAGANLTIEYLKIPPALSADASVPLDGHTLLTPYHDAIAYGAAASLLDINPDQQSIAKVGQYQRKYRNIVTECIDTFRNMGEKRPINVYRGRNPYNVGR